MNHLLWPESVIMKMRIKAGRLLLRIGAFLKSLPVVVMKPDDLIEFSRQSYSKPQIIWSWAEDALVDSGLNDYETALVTALPVKAGRILVLGVGGGREAIVFAKMGYEVTGLDFVEKLVGSAIENAAKRGVQIAGLVNDYSRLTIPENSYDVIWMTRAMYSSVPTRQRRVDMIRKIGRALKPDGYFICQFHQDKRFAPSVKGTHWRKIIAFLAFGNRKYESGDILWGDVEFLHVFANSDQVRSELEEGGLQVSDFVTSSHQIHCGAICRKIG